MNNRHNSAIFKVYQEGIFDRLGARAKGVMNTKMFGGTGYNQGKAADFKNRLYDRIAKDIDKFLDEVQTMDNMRSLDDFESKYPEIAKKVACMAQAINHPTPLKTQCSEGGGDDEDDFTPPPPIDEKWECAPAPGGGSSCRISDTGIYNSKEECEAKCGGGTPVPPVPVPPVPPVPAPPVPPKPPATWSCSRTLNRCVRRYDGTGRFKSIAECEAKCGGGGGGAVKKPKPNSGSSKAQQIINFVINAAEGSTVTVGDVVQAFKTAGVKINKEKVNYIKQKVKQEFGYTITGL